MKCISCLRVWIFLIVFLLLFFVGGKESYAQAPVDAIPKPYVACSDVRENEFHSLRPYQASPCNREVQDTALYCGNDVIITDQFSVRKGDAVSCDEQDGRDVCHFNYSRTQNVVVDLRNTKLPIAGNTENVRNFTNAKEAEDKPEEITDPQKVNEYVSWYLNGVNDRAEYPYNNGTDTRDISPKNKIADGYDRLVTLSGPLKKLLPLHIQQKERMEEVVKAYLSDTGSAAQGTRHNQIVACTGKSAFPLVVGPLTFAGPEVPIPCNRQTFWTNIVVSEQKKRLSEWYAPQNIPPQEEDYKDKPFTDYWEAYQEWRGKICGQIPTPLGAILLCVNDPIFNVGIPDYIAELFPYIPLSSTEDRTGRFWLEQNPQGSGKGDDVRNLTIQNSQLSGDTQQDLYFPHMEENDQLADLLQQMYVPQGMPRNAPAAPSVIAAGQSCEVRKASANPGDNLFGRTLSTQLNYKADFEADFALSSKSATFECAANAALQGVSNPSCYPDGSYECSNDYGGCGSGYSCSGGCRKNFPDSYDISVNHAISSFTETPYADSLWSRLVAGPTSAFKRIFPKFGANSPIAFLEDTPAVTNASYSSTSPNADVFAGSTKGQRPGSQAEIFFPHLGGIHQYFLRCLQEMIRPQGFGAGCGNDDFGGDITSVFGEPINISNSDRRSVFPWIVLDSTGNPHIIYAQWNANDTGPESIMYANGPGATPVALPIPNAVQSPSRDRQPAVLGIGPSNTLHFIYLAGNSERPALYYIKGTIIDSATTWSTPELVSQNEGKSAEPHLTVDASGNAHIVWLNDSRGDANVYYRVRNVSGGFSDIQRIVPASSFEGRPQITVTTDGKPHVLFQYQNDIWYARLDGSTWVTQNISQTPDNSYNPSITTNGTALYAAWDDHGHDVIFKSSEDGGSTWSSEIGVSTTPELASYPNLSYSAGTGRVYAVWSDETGTPGDPEIWYAEYAPSAHSFTLPIRITELDNGGNSALPVVATTSSAIGVVWHDNATGTYQVYYLGGILGAGAPGNPSPGGPVPGACSQTDSEIRTRITESWDLPSPKPIAEGGARGYETLKSQITGGNGDWAATEMLDGERYAQGHGFPQVKTYLTTAWLWFENGAASFPNPYAINCNKESVGTDLSRVSKFCPYTNFQSAGYQAGESRKNYRETFNMLYGSSTPLSHVLGLVITNSGKAGSSVWMYNSQNPDNNQELMRHLGSALTATTSNLSTSGSTMIHADPTNEEAQKTQFLSLMAGKAPAMVAAFNSQAVSDRDLIAKLNGAGCAYGYICATEKQILSNMVYALYLKDCGR